MVQDVVPRAIGTSAARHRRTRSRRATHIPNVCSHLDLLPTLLDIATEGGEWPDLASDLDGRSLWPSATGRPDDVDETTAEYFAEMTSHPMFMIRRGRLKYIHCDTDPPQLYDVEADPLERTNLARDRAHRVEAQAFADEVAQRWDSDDLRRKVMASQRSRRLLHEASQVGPLVSWDYLPLNDVANTYVRNHQDWAEAGARFRFPPYVAPDQTHDDSSLT